MAIAGSLVHQQLMDAYAETQSALEVERVRITRSRGDRDDLTNDRGDALISLAEHYLPELTREAMEETWREIRPDLSQLLLRKEDRQRQLQQQAKQLIASQQISERQLLETNRSLDEATDVQQTIAEQVEHQLGKDKSFVRLSNRAAVAEAALERAEANLEEIDADAERKLPAYDHSALFQYLYDRGFSTPSYKKRGFTRRIDRMLAKYIGFADARQGYEFLKKTPGQMRRIIADDSDALDTVMGELERQRDGIAESLGLPAITKQAESLRSQRDGQLETLDQIHVDTDTTQHNLNELEDGRGPYYREAIGLFREMLDRIDSDALQQRAGETPDITDDQIVARLIGVETSIERVDEAAQQRADGLIEMQEFLGGLGRLVQRFRAAQFDLDRSRFVGSLDLPEELDRARELGDIDHLWRRIRSAQRWGDHEQEASDQSAGYRTHPTTMSQVLVNAMEHATDEEMAGHARRAGHRHTGHRHTGAQEKSGQ